MEIEQTPLQANNVLEICDASLSLGKRILWEKLNVRIQQGEFIAVLGSNGAGKTTLLKVILGLLPLSCGSVSIFNQLAHRGNLGIGYIPQQKSFDRALPIRGRDLVELGLNGYQYGLHRRKRSVSSSVDKAIDAVGAQAYADMPIGLLSGGEQQRLRIAQALVGEPRLLLCDEPLLSLDVASQTRITSLIDDYRKRTEAAVIFVTHEINPVLQYVDRVLYLAKGQWIIDTPDKVLQSNTLSKLYGTPIEVLRVKNRILVVGAEDATTTNQGSHHEEHR